MSHVSEAGRRVEFGRYTIEPHRRELLADGRPVKLGGRAFDLLMALIEASGAVVKKDVLLDRVWPGRIVEENRLQNQISALRKAFGADHELIRTVAGRGYQFTGDIRARAPGFVGQSVAERPHGAFSPPNNLPRQFSELIGRDTELGEITNLLAEHRLVTLTGIGGIGKTTLGLEIARQLQSEFADGVWIAELGPLSDPDLIPVTVATALGLEMAAGTRSAQRVADALGSRPLLLVLDNCEHVVEAAANMAEALLRASPSTRVVATSREALRVPGECIYRVLPLGVPAEGVKDPDEVLRHGAARLFVARARDADPHFSLDSRAAGAMAAICRRLDGMPLAIELAAARTASLGLEGLASRLDDRFRLLTGGRRTAFPRQQTLRATLDWSYELLRDPERAVLRRLAVFRGSFSLEAASTVVASAEIAGSDGINHVPDLVEKSLVVADAAGTTVNYRLLETTRAYAFDKLAQSGEFEQVARRHAEYHRDLFERAESEWETRPAAEWVVDYGRCIDDVRSSLDWAFSPNGDTSVGVALAAASAGLWGQLSLPEECRRHVDRALAGFPPGSIRGERRAMLLYTALGESLFYIKGPVPETGAAWMYALEIAENLNDTDYQLRALYGLWACRNLGGEYRASLAFAQRFCSIAVKQTDPADMLIGDRMTGVVLHFLGDQASAREHIERMLARYVAPVRRSHTIRFQYDQRIVAAAFLARIFWLQGFPDRAVSTVQSIIGDPPVIGHARSYYNALAQAACPISLFVGDLPAAERAVATLLDEAARHALAVWYAWGRAFEAILCIKRGDTVNGLAQLRSARREPRETGFAALYAEILRALAEALTASGEVDEGLATVDEALARSERNEERWCVAELLRIKGELILLQAGTDAVLTAEDHFRQAIDWGGRQSALSWELRAATSLARLWCDQRRREEAYQLLAPIYDRFTEGIETADLKAAKALIDHLRPGVLGER
jgi:predicted ATPase/DNA-binding winged helix-turn-helix (wHTH) protein